MKILSFIWKKWLYIGKKIGNFNAIVLFSVFYLILISFPALAVKIFSDPLNIKNKSRKSSFTKWQIKKETLQDARMQF